MCSIDSCNFMVAAICGMLAALMLKLIKVVEWCVV